MCMYIYFMQIFHQYILSRDAYRLHFMALQLLIVAGGAIKRIVI